MAVSELYHQWQRCLRDANEFNDLGNDAASLVAVSDLMAIESEISKIRDNTRGALIAKLDIAVHNARVQHTELDHNWRLVESALADARASNILM